MGVVPLLGCRRREGDCSRHEGPLVRRQQTARESGRQLRPPRSASGAVSSLVAVFYGADEEFQYALAPWLNLALVGVVISTATNGAGLLRGRQRIRRRIRLLRETLESDMGGRLTAAAAAESRDSHLVAAPGMKYFHRPDCPLAVGKPVRKQTRVAHGRANREACRVCEP